MFFFLVTVVLLAFGNVDSNPLTKSRLPSGRIVGGENAKIETYPYQVSFEYINIHVCGGSIISDHYVLTAAHCIEAEDLNDTVIRAGSSFRGKGGSVHQLEKLIVHEKYHKNKYGVPVFDVAVVRVKEPFHFDETRQPISLYEKTDKVFPGQMAVITGWGFNEDFEMPPQLQAVVVPIVDSKLCYEVYLETHGELPAGQICDGYYGIGGKDSCMGDSGGPVAIDGRLAGIVSWADGCADAKYPGVNTDVAYFRDWIDKHVEY